MIKLKATFKKVFFTLMGPLLSVTTAMAQNVTNITGVTPPMVVQEGPSTDRVGLAPFKQGYAAITVGSERYYINTQGEKIRLLGDAVLGDAYSAGEYGREMLEAENPSLPSKKIIFEKEGKHGVLSLTGELILPAEYDHIEANYRQFWKLYKGNKKTFRLPDGGTLPLFDDIGYLDGEYFDVKQNDTWHLYSKSKGKVVTKEAYESFDFCGGCSTEAHYVYAKKDGKWGVIDWKEKILVPFEYEHEHRSMRNDVWVASFSRNGKEVIVHIPTQQVFDATAHDTQLLSGIMVSSEKGLFGAYGRDGKLIVPFEYDKLESPNANSYLGYHGNYLIAKKNHKIGVINAEGNIVLPVEYNDVSVYDDFFVAKKGGQTYLFSDKEEAPLLTLENAEINHINEYYYSSGSGGLAIFRVKQKAYYGLYFADKKQFYEPAFYGISLQRNKLMEEGGVIEAEKQGVKTLFNIEGKKVLPFDAQDYGTFDAKAKSLLAFKIKGKWGLYDMERMKEIVPARYDQYFRLLDGSATVVIQAYADGFAKIDLYDLQGTKFNDTVLNRVDPIDNQYYLLEKGKSGELRYAIFDTEGDTLEDLTYPYVAALHGTRKLLMVSHNGHDGKLYDFRSGKELDRWYNVYMFAVDIDVPEDSEHWLFYGFQDGYATVQSKEGNVGFIDEKGDIVISPKYPWARMFGKNHVLVNEGDYLNSVSVAYFTDMKGKRIFPPEYGAEVMFYSVADDFDLKDKVILLKEDIDGRLRSGLGDLNTGKILISADYKELLVSTVDSSYIILSKEIAENTTDRGRGRLKFGLANTDGKIVFKPQFDAIYRPRFDVYNKERKREPFFPLLVYQNDKWRYINEDGSYLAIEGSYVSGY